MSDELKEAFTRIIEVLDQAGGSFGLGRRDNGQWLVALHFGKEADDSPMVGGAAYGLADTAEQAVLQLRADLR